MALIVLVGYWPKLFLGMGLMMPRPSSGSSRSALQNSEQCLRSIRGHFNAAAALSSAMSRKLLLSILQPSSNRAISLRTLQDLSTAKFVRRVSVRNASTASPPKTIALEKPDKFRPPSHPQRLNRKAPRQYPGPPLSQAERQVQKTKRYPHMFPNEGTPLHWFLTNKWIHMWISLVCCNAILLSRLLCLITHASITPKQKPGSKGTTC
jgi:hypothetical protein